MIPLPTLEWRLIPIALRLNRVSDDTCDSLTRVDPSTTTATHRLGPTVTANRTRGRPDRVAVGSINRDVRLLVREIEPVASSRGVRRPRRLAPFDVNDQVAVGLPDEPAVPGGAVVAAGVAAPQGVHCGGATVFVDDEVAVQLHEEADAVVDGGEG